MNEKREISRYFRFRLRTLFLVMTLLCVLSAVFAQPMVEARRQERLLADMRKLGATVSIHGRREKPPSLRRTLLGIFLDTKYSHSRLYGFDFSGTKVTNDDLKPLLEIDHVHQLDLNGTSVSDASLAMFSQFEHLHRLDLSGTKVSDNGISQLENMQKLASLRTMGTEVSYSALEQLDSQLPWAHFCEERAIEEVKSFGGQVVSFDRAIDAIEAPYVVHTGYAIPGVILGMNSKLSLNQSDMLHVGYLKSVEELNLHDIQLSRDCLTVLQPFTLLKELTISFVNITDNDLQSLSRHPKLHKLALYDCDDITDAGVTSLAKIKTLEELSVKACEQVTEAIVDQIQNELPNCRVEYGKY